MCLRCLFLFISWFPALIHDSYSSELRRARFSLMQNSQCCGQEVHRPHVPSNHTRELDLESFVHFVCMGVAVLFLFVFCFEERLRPILGCFSLVSVF